MPATEMREWKAWARFQARENSRRNEKPVATNDEIMALLGAPTEELSK